MSSVSALSLHIPVNADQIGGSSKGKDAAHLQSARDLANSLAQANYQLVYGGGTKGVMGELARTFVQARGEKSVTGIIPRALVTFEKDPSQDPYQDSHSSTDGVKEAERTMSREQLKRADTNEAIPSSEVGQTIIVTDMHTRKNMMAQKVVSGGPGSGFVALAGGYGTLEEVAEMVTWNQLGIHKVPVVLVNVNGYWNGLIDFVKNSIQEGFVGEGNANILTVVEDPKDVVEALNNYKVAEGRFKLDWSNS